jgi:hypothetical protein
MIVASLERHGLGKPLFERVNEYLASQGLSQALDRIWQAEHQPIPEQGYWLRQVVAGFFAYTRCRPTVQRWKPSTTM